MLASSPDHLFGTAESAFFVVWRRQTTYAAVEQLFSLVPGFAARQPHFALVVVIEESAELPSAAIRERIAAGLRRVAPSIAISAVVYEGSGFRAAAVRSVLAGLGLIVRPPYAHKIFARVDDAAHWIARERPGFDRARLCESLAALRSQAPRV